MGDSYVAVPISALTTSQDRSSKLETNERHWATDGKQLKRETATLAARWRLRHTCTVIRKISGGRAAEPDLVPSKVLYRINNEEMEKDMKAKSKISGYTIRSAAYPTFLLS